MHDARIGQCLARGEDKREDADRGHQLPAHSIGHGTHSIRKVTKQYCER
jgi:hypothetical protein